MIHTFLRDLRQRRRLTLGRLSLLSGVHKATLSRWESGAFLPRIPELKRVLTALDATDDERAACLRLLDVPRAIHAEEDEPAGRLRISLGDMLFGLRQRVHRTQQEVARAAGISRSLYAQWENDAGRPSDAQLHRIGFALGATAEEIVGISQVIFSERPIVKSREELIAACTESMPWDHPFTGETHALYLLALLGSVARLVRDGAAGPADLALVLVQFGSHIGIWRDDEPAMERYFRRALDCAAQSDVPLEMPVIAAFQFHVGQAQQWIDRFRTDREKAYLLSYIARDIADTAPDAALRLADQYCDMVADHPDELPCRLRDRANLLRRCGRPREAIHALEAIEPQDALRAGVRHVDIARALAVLGEKRRAQESLDTGRDALTRLGYAGVNIEVRRTQREIDALA